MKTLQSLFLVPLALSIAQVLGHRSLFQFRNMIVCVMPDSWPLFDYTDYGCYCGMGGSGTPVDGLDRCCQVHDCCYSAAQQHPDCQTFFGHPYIKQYYWSCDHDDRRPTCLSKNNICEMFICECDRKAAECFGRNTWNPDHKRLPRDRCVDNLNMNTCPATNVYEAMQSYHKV